MRNILTFLMLCFLTLTTSSVFATSYDASLRTERMGLSFYDGRPLYVISFEDRRADGSRGGRYFLYRVHTGESIEEFGYKNSYYFDGRYEDVYDASGAFDYRLLYFYCEDDDGRPVLLSSVEGYDPDGTLFNHVRRVLEQVKFPAYSGDVAVDIFDALLKPLQEWLGGALGFWLAIGVVFLGWQYLRRLARGGVAIGGKSAEVEASNDDFLEGFRRRRAEKLAAEQEREKFESFQKAWGAIRELGEADAYATGEAFGLTFTDKVVKSNQILQEAWSRLSEDERRFLANEARALAWQDDLIGEKEKIYRQSVMETALSDLDGVDASSVFSNPFEDATYYDDDNGGTPF